MFLYEYIGIMSYMAFIDVIINFWSMANCDVEANWDKSYFYIMWATVIYISCFLVNWIAYCIYWVQISIGHIMKWKLTAVSKFEDKLLYYACGTLIPIFHLQTEPHMKYSIDDSWMMLIILAFYQLPVALFVPYLVYPVDISHGYLLPCALFSIESCFMVTFVYAIFNIIGL